ncbi:hypothetical protein Salat_3000900 [Sesamum alatum]|uniref:Uncharacterized protein n=1 Tax=Sesamum alatum TaxID=300844 RepID=A0AAE1XID8_9LAMI|nr:hypothetical protein Salat_3000900 [Sesamum alatum]
MTSASEQTSFGIGSKPRTEVFECPDQTKKKGAKTNPSFFSRYGDGFLVGVRSGSDKDTVARFNDFSSSALAKLKLERTQSEREQEHLCYRRTSSLFYAMVTINLAPPTEETMRVPKYGISVLPLSIDEKPHLSSFASPGICRPRFPPLLFKGKTKPFVLDHPVHLVNPIVVIQPSARSPMLVSLEILNSCTNKTEKEEHYGTAQKKH